MTYEEALYHKLMLQAGIPNQYEIALSDLLKNENPLSDIILELSFCGSDINKTISVLYNYILDQTINYNAVFDVIWEDMRRMYFDKKITKEEVLTAMYSVACNSGMQYEEPWQTMYLLHDYYDEAEMGYINKKSLDCAFYEFLNNKTPITQSTQLKQQEQRRFEDNIHYEKNHMNRIRYIMNYLIVPAYVVLSAVIMIAFGILMGIDDMRYLSVGLSLLGAFVFLTIALLSFVPFVRKKIRMEMSRYDFDTSSEVLQDRYDFSTENDTLKFDKNGMHINDDFFWYNHLEIMIVTSNYLNRISLLVVFMIDIDNWCEIPLCAETISMIRHFAIKLQNPEVLDYITGNKEQAFTQIYKTGKVQIKL